MSSQTTAKTGTPAAGVRAAVNPPYTGLPISAAAFVSKDESINFFRLCRIVLDDVPNVLRNIFKREFQQKYQNQWTDDRASGKMLIKHDHWQARLNKSQLALLEGGNRQHWDSTLLFHVLLHSSMCLFADLFQGTQCILTVQSKSVHASVQTFDFRRVLKIGYTVIFELQKDQFRTEVVAIHKSCFFTKHAFRPQHGFLQPQQSSMTVEMYVCQREWSYINELAEIRNSSFAHCEAAVVEEAKLHKIVQRTERIYNNLHVPKSVVAAMKAIEREPIAESSVVKEIEFYREKWLKEHELYQVIARDVTELKDDVDELKTKVREVSDVILPQTQREMDTMKQEFQQEVKARGEMMIEVTEARQNITKAKDELHSMSLEIEQTQKVVSTEVEEHGKGLQVHTQELYKHERQLENTENKLAVMHNKQTNDACRVSYAIKEISHLAQHQKETKEQVKQAEKSITMISETERQLSEEVVRTKECIQQISATEEETMKQVVLLERNLTTMQTQLQAKSVGKLEILNSSDFTADMKYYAKQHHSETRKWLFDDMEQWHIQSGNKKVKICLITGNPGMGKSVVASKFCTIASERGILGACFFFQHHKTRRNNPKTLVQTLAYQFCFEFPNYKDLIEKHLKEETLVQMSTSELFTDLILEPLHKLHITDKKVIVIDGLDECDFEARDELLKLILREFVKLPDWIGVIMTTRQDQRILKRLSRIKPVFELNPDDPRNISDIKLYLGDILKGRMQSEEFEEGLQIMVKKSEGMFLYFHYASESILQHRTLTLKDLDSLLPDGIDDFYEQNFRRLFNKLGEGKYQLLLQAITAARSEFPQALIAPLLNITHEESLQIADTISVLLPVHHGCVSLFHKSIKDWLTDEDLAEDLVIYSTAGHRHVAALCYKEFTEIKSTAPNREELVKNHVAKYVIDHLVYHLCSAHEQSLTAKLCSIVTDLQYMYYKLVLSTASAKDLIDALFEATKMVSAGSKAHQKLEVCSKFVYRYAQILGSMPQLIFQCALNGPRDVASQLCLEQYRDNPAQHFPGLDLYLELINKPQTFASALTEYHCESKITSLAITPDRKVLVCSDSGGKIYLWDKQSGDLLQEGIAKDRNFLFPITECSVSPDGNLILFGNLREAFSINGTTLPFFDSATPDLVNTCIFSSNGQFVAAWSYYTDGVLRFFAEIGMSSPVQYVVQIWNRATATSKTLESTRRNEVRPLCSCFSHESAYIACGHKDGSIIIWETNNYKPKAMLSIDGTIIRQGPFKRAESPRDDPINDITYSLNGHYLAASHNKGITIWDAASLNLCQKLMHTPDILQVCPDVKYISCSFSADTKNLAAGLSNGYISVWTKQPSSEGPYVLQLSTKPHGSSNPVFKCLFEDDQTVVCAMDSAIYIYSYDSLLKNPTLEDLAQHPNYATSSAILPDGQTGLTCGHGSLCSWNVCRSCRIASAQSTVSGHMLRVSADGKLALTFGTGCCIQVWETGTLKKISSLYSTSSSAAQTETDDPDSSSPHDICYCAVSTQGTIVGGTGEGVIYIWCSKNESVKVIEEHRALITCMEFSYEGDCFVSGDMDGCITMWQLGSCTEDTIDVSKVTMQRHADSVEKVIFSPGQLQRIISCGSDNVLHMYNSHNGDMIKRMEGHTSQVLTAAYSASGEHIASGDGKSQLILWDGFTGQLIRRFASSSGHTMLDLYFSVGDGYVCMRDSNQEFVQVYSVSTGTCMSQIDFSSPISTFAASSLEKDLQSYMACGLKDGSVKFLKLCKAL